MTTLSRGPHWNHSPYGPSTAHTGTAVDIYVLTVLSYLERRGVARTGWNLRPDGILDWTESRQIEQNIYGSFNSLPVMPATSHLHTQQIPATCCACCQLDCNQHPKIVADQTVQYSFMYWFLRLAHHSHSFVD